MIYESPPGGVYIGQPSYANFGFGWCHSTGSYWATTPPWPLDSGALTPYADFFPLNVSENVIWSGTQKNDEVDGDGYYWDSENEKWAVLAEGKRFVLRPYIFKYLYDSADFVASISTTVSTTGRPHWKNVLDDTTNNMHLCPLFWTPKGLALPSYAEASNWNFPTYQSSGSGNSMLDCALWLSSSVYPVVGLCVLGQMDSESVGGLINDKVSTLSTAWIGQTDGYFSANVCGRPSGYLGVSPWSLFRDASLSSLPWSGKTIKEVCSVTVGTRGGIFK